MKKIIVAVFTCFIACHGLAQNGEGETGPYRKFAIYARCGTQLFFQ